MSRKEMSRARRFALFRNPASSILSRLIYFCFAFGMLVGAMFPLYAEFFVEWKPGMQLWFVLGCVVSGVIIGLVNFLLVEHIVIRPLRQIREIAKAVSEKDLTKSCNIKSEDVIGDISISINTMLEMLENIVKELSSRTSSVAQSSFEVSSLISEVKDKAVSQQNESTASSNLISELLRGVTDINNTAVTASNSASETENNASQGGEELQASMTSISNLASELDNATNTMNALEQRSDAVGNVVKVISEIAEQTNLLALNAAIEAARAGEQGRGFAVVADEVRVLASKTHDSTSEIQTIIEELQRETKAAVVTIGNAKNTAHENSQTVSSVANKLMEIIGSMSAIANMNRQIEHSSTEQRRSNETVNTSVGNILAMSGVVVSDANKSLQEIENLIELTGDLQELICEFKLKDLNRGIV